MQRTPDGPRLYRQADVDQVLRIKQLVFGEGLTVSGARRRLDDTGPPKVSEAEVAEVLSTLGSAARTKVASVRQGLQALKSMLAQKPGEFVLKPPPVKAAKVVKASKTAAKSQKTAASSKRAVAPARVAARKAPDVKRRRASA